MKEIVNDWRPEATALINRLESMGAQIIRAYNGEEEFEFPKVSSIGPREKFIENLVACDEAWLYVNIGGKTRALYIVLGNEPGEIVSDYTCDPVLDLVTDQHYAEWRLKGQPKREVD